MKLRTFLRFMRKLKRELARDGITPFFILDGGAVRIVFAYTAVSDERAD